MSAELSFGFVAATEAWAWARSETGWLRRSVFALDAYLRQRYGIVEFTSRPECILRIAPAAALRTLELSDGTRIRPGDPILDLHLWNEHLPAIPAGGVTLRWAAGAARCSRTSLRLLAAAAEAGSLPEFVAVRGCLRFDGRLLEAPFAGCGFDTIADPPILPGKWLHGLGEICLLAMLVWAFNPTGLHNAKLTGARRSVWMSRARLLQRHRSIHG